MKKKAAPFIIIPAEVRHDNRLTAGAKLMYGEIYALSNKKGLCWATNRYFAALYGTSTKTVSRWISELVKHGYVGFWGSMRQRKMYISMLFNQAALDKNVYRALDKNVHDNNTRK